MAGKPVTLLVSKDVHDAFDTILKEINGKTIKDKKDITISELCDTIVEVICEERSDDQSFKNGMIKNQKEIDNAKEILDIIYKRFRSFFDEHPDFGLKVKKKYMYSKDIKPIIEDFVDGLYSDILKSSSKVEVDAKILWSYIKEKKFKKRLLSAFNYACITRWAFFSKEDLCEYMKNDRYLDKAWKGAQINLEKEQAVENIINSSFDKYCAFHKIENSSTDNIKLFMEQFPEMIYIISSELFRFDFTVKEVEKWREETERNVIGFGAKEGLWKCIFDADLPEQALDFRNISFMNQLKDKICDKYGVSKSQKISYIASEEDIEILTVNKIIEKNIGDVWKYFFSGKIYIRAMLEHFATSEKIQEKVIRSLVEEEKCEEALG